MVSSLAAMYWSVNPDLAASEVRDRLFASVYTPEDYPWDPPHTWPDGMFRINDPPGGDVGDPYYGVGILDSYLLFGS
jgi:hypothetical protein